MGAASCLEPQRWICSDPSQYEVWHESLTSSGLVTVLLSCQNYCSAHQGKECLSVDLSSVMLCGFVTLNRENPFPAGPEPVKLCTLAGYWGGPTWYYLISKILGVVRGFFVALRLPEFQECLDNSPRDAQGWDYWGIIGVSVQGQELDWILGGSFLLRTFCDDPVVFLLQQFLTSACPWSSPLCCAWDRLSGALQQCCGAGLSSFVRTGRSWWWLPV